MMVRVMAVGIFDLLHAGHLHYVEQAKSLGDELVVVIAHDETVRKQETRASNWPGVEKKDGGRAETSGQGNCWKPPWGSYFRDTG